MKEYKILAQSDSFWRDRFSPLVLQEALNDHAAEGWSVIAITTTDFTGLGGFGTKRHELFVVLERERAHPNDPTPLERGEYDDTRIPEQRFYAEIGGTDGALRQAGIIDDEGLAMAQRELAERGGHLCDHLVALALVDEPRLRQFFRDYYQMENI